MKKTIILAIVGLFAFAQAANAQFYVGGSFHINNGVLALSWTCPWRTEARLLRPIRM